MEIHRELANLLEEFFKRPKADKRGSQPISAPANQDDECQSVGPDTDDDNDDDQAEVALKPTDPKVVEGQVNALLRAEKAQADDDIEEIDTLDTPDDTDSNCDPPPGPADPHLAKCDKSSETYNQFKQLVRTNKLGEIPVETSKLMALLTVTDSDKCGSIKMDAKFMSRSQRWFNQKSDKKDATVDPEKGTADLFLRRNSLIELRCKVHGQEQILEYRALAFFTKYYNKWFPSIEDEFSWVNDSSKKPNAIVLARLVTKSGSSYEEVELKKNGDWGPHHVFRTVQFKDIVRVGNELVDF